MPMVKSHWHVKIQIWICFKLPTWREGIMNMDSLIFLCLRHHFYKWFLPSSRTVL
jgi:hypothetical protein